MGAAIMKMLTGEKQAAPTDPHLARNAPFAKPEPWQTQLEPKEEVQFRQWVAQNKIPHDPNDPKADYDMRGFWKAQQAGDPQAKRSTKNLHFPDTWKTPYHESFSNESKYAQPNTPFKWKGDMLIDERNGSPIYPAAAGRVHDVIDNSNTPYGRGSLAQHFHSGSFEDPSDRAAQDIIGQLRRNTR